MPPEFGEVSPLKVCWEVGGNHPCYLAQLGKIPPIPAANEIFNTYVFQGKLVFGSKKRS